jgi:hypothetical protein
MKSKSFIVVLFMLFALLSSAFAGHTAKGSPSSLKKTTAKDMFHVELKLERDKLSVGKNNADVTIRDKREKPVTGARLTVRPHVARHGETSFIRPSVTEKGDGVYHVKNIYIDTLGNWELKVTVRKDDAEDSVVFDFPGVKRRE